MNKHHPENERLKHRYQEYLGGRRGRSEATIDKAMTAIHQFEVYTGYKAFKAFHYRQAQGFVQDLLERRNPATGKLYSKATLNGVLLPLRKFFDWLAGQPGFEKVIRYGDAEYFRLNDKDNRIARATRPKRVPAHDEVRRVIAAMSADNETDLRDRAMVAFTLLTGARVSAIVSALVKDVDIKERLFHQDARHVRTKRSKTFTTWFFPVGKEVFEMVVEWHRFLVEEKCFGPDDPLFPATHVGHDDNRHYIAVGIGRAPYATGNKVREVFRKAFSAIGLPSPNPHVIRDTLMQLGMRICRTPEQLKAWSQNLGHEKVLTTFTSYGKVPEHRQAEIIRGLAKVDDAEPSPIEGEPDNETVQWVVGHLAKRAGR